MSAEQFTDGKFNVLAFKTKLTQNESGGLQAYITPVANERLEFIVNGRRVGHIQTNDVGIFQTDLSQAADLWEPSNNLLNAQGEIVSLRPLPPEK